MKFLRLALLLALCGGLFACETLGGKKLSKGDVAARQVDINGLKLGSRKKTALAYYPQAMKQPFGRVDREVYEIPNPSPHISMAVAYFVNDRLIKLELRYFDGVGVNTLSGAGGWSGLRDYMIAKFGPPTKTGPAIPQESEFGDLKPQYAKFCGEWDFPKVNRVVQYIALADEKGGVGVVTFVDTTPLPGTYLVVQPTSAQQQGGTVRAPIVSGPPNPGF